MNISRKRRTSAIVILSLLGLVAVAIAKPVKKHNHHGGHALVSSKLKTDGTHQIHKNGKHTVSAEVKKGKIAGIHVKHDTKGDVPVKKYKTHKKMASLEGAPPEAIATQDTDLGTTYIGYAFVDDDGNEEYYWFPYEEILDGDTGAIEYVPLS